MSRFLLGALVMGAVFVLTSFATRLPVTTVAPKGGPAWTVSQYQLDRAFRVPLQVSIGMPISVQMPPTGGLVITQVGTFGHTAGGCSITVNGVTENFIFNASNSTPSGCYDLNPPIVARPGDLLTIAGTFQSPIITIAGYTTLPGET